MPMTAPWVGCGVISSRKAFAPYEPSPTRWHRMGHHGCPQCAVRILMASVRCATAAPRGR